VIDSHDLFVVEVRFFDGRFHGEPEWPPCPARLFQGLVASAANGRRLQPAEVRALEWLERQSPPLIVAPTVRRGDGIVLYVPNNDLDEAEGGDLKRLDHVRVRKEQAPRIFDSAASLAFAWSMKGSTEAPDHVSTLKQIAHGLYQLGRGIDAAWAIADTWPPAEFEKRIREPGACVWRPGARRGLGPLLDCPAAGSLQSLETRHEIQRRRLQVAGSGRSAKQVLEQAPRPRFAPVEYGSGPHLLTLALRPADAERSRTRAYEAWPLTRVHDLAVSVRDAAYDRLVAALPDAKESIRQQLIGRRPGETDGLRADQRVRIVPLPSIGSSFADHAIRRVLVLIPDWGPLAHDDLAWSFRGLTIDTPNGSSATLVGAEGDPMPRHYGQGARAYRRWRSVTPVALPRRPSARRRSGTDELRELDAIREAVLNALRHADVDVCLTSLRAQREPTSPRGAAARRFAVPPRFGADRLWHVELEVTRPCKGPLVIGDGRYLGLGVLAPLTEPAPLALRVVDGLSAEKSCPEGLVHALRRALLAVTQEVVGTTKQIPASLSGHDDDGRPARDHRHLHLAWDAPRTRFLVLPPRSPHDAAILDEALSHLTSLRAGAAGRLSLRLHRPDAARDPLLAPSSKWRTITRYTVCRHHRCGDASTAIARDVERECRLAGLPRPSSMDVNEVSATTRIGLSGNVTLEFHTAIPGPLLLGRTRHKGGGLFECASEESA